MNGSDRKPRLLYFTESYPYGLGEEWKRRELETFRAHFGTIEVVPLHFGGNRVAKPAIEGITYHHPIFEGSIPRRSPAERLGSLLSHPKRKLFLRELYRQRAPRTRAGFSQWLSASHFMTVLDKQPRLRELLRTDPSSTVLYFFWARGISELLPLLDCSKFRRVALRLHGYDLYADRGQFALPYQGDQLACATDILPCSEYGARYLRDRYPERSGRIRVARLGSDFVGLSRPSEDGTLRLVTCAFVNPVKRLHLVVDALKHVTVPVEWTHIGDGDLFDDLKSRAVGLQRHENVKVRFLGRLDPGNVALHYLDNPVDLFLNVSSSEGLPVSIMEAFAAGVPAIATAVGGTPEIVDEESGRLLDADCSPGAIGRAIMAFAAVPKSERHKLRVAAHAKFQRLFDARRNAEALALSLAG